MTAGYAGKRFILERAHALGVVVVVVDSPESWSHGLVAEGIVDHFIADVAPHEEQDHEHGSDTEDTPLTHEDATPVRS